MAADRQRGFRERFQQGFTPADPVAFARLMLDQYGNRCALMGAKHDATEDGLHPILTIFLFQPLSHQGALEPSNAIVVELAVASLLERGLVLIDDQYEAYLPQSEEASDAGADATAGRRQLHLPEDRAFWPDRAMLAYHRSLFNAQ